MTTKMDKYYGWLFGQEPWPFFQDEPNVPMPILRGEEATKSKPPSDFKDDPDAKCWCGKCGATLIGDEGESLCGSCAGEGMGA